jgi:hypothetical protein
MADALSDLVESLPAGVRPRPDARGATRSAAARDLGPPGDEPRRPPQPLDAVAPVGTARRRRLVADLSSPERLREAFMLMEILGPPVALRDPQAGRQPG